MINIVKAAFSDIYILYKNFIHWNFSKIIIFCFSVCLWLLIIIPFLILYFIFSWFSLWELYNLIISIIFTWKVLTWYLANVFYLLIVWLSTIWFMYSYILLIKLNLNYLKDKKIWYLKSVKFNCKNFLKYIGLSCLFLLVLSIPIIIFLILITILFLILWWYESVLAMVNESFFNYFSIISLLTFLLTIFIIFYFAFRLIFSFIFLVEEEKLWVIWLFKKSFKKTSGFKKLFKWILLFFIMWICLFPFFLLGAYINNEKNDLDNFVRYETLNIEQKTQILDSGNYYYSGLVVKYNGINLEEISRKQFYYKMYIILFYIFKFLFIYWLFTMLLTSFYKRIIIKD